jgi:hypothetical protein
VQIPCWMLKAAPYLCFICIFWGVGRLSSRRDSQFVWPWQDRRSRKEAMDQGFAKAVDSVAKQVKSSGRSSGSSRRVEPLSGKYKCVMRCQDIISRHDSTSLFPRQAPVPPYTMNLEVCEAPDGCGLEGYRIDGNGNRWELEESHINNQGHSYWVERYSEYRILARGKFVNAKVFEGEWMMSDGNRGKYSEFVYVPPAKKSSRLEVHVGVPLQTEKNSLLTRLVRNIWPFSGKALGTTAPLTSETV